VTRASGPSGEPDPTTEALNQHRDAAGTSTSAGTAEKAPSARRGRRMGPGAIVAAAFIGPGTVTTATLAGAQFGYSLLWALTFSVLATVIFQEMAARLGLVTRAGLGEAIRNRFAAGPGRFVPGDVLGRAGACLIILGVIAHLSRRITRLPHIFGAVAQESLLIYFVHLCIVYGSVWNPGLAQVYGSTLSPAQTVVIVVLLVLAMVGLAWYWNWWKHAGPAAARWTARVVWALLLFRLF